MLKYCSNFVAKWHPLEKKMNKNLEPVSEQQASDLHLSRRSLLKMGVASLAAVGVATSTPLKANVIPLGFSPISGLPGDSVNLFGPEFGPNFADISVQTVNGSRYGFLQPLGFVGNELDTLITAVPRTMQDGIFQTVQGIGRYSMPSNLPAELTLNTPIRSWLGNDGKRCQSYQSFTYPWSSSQTGNCLSYWGGVTNGRLNVDLVVPFNEDCCPACPAGTRMTLRLYGSTPNNNFECEYQATLISTTPLYTSHIADALCAILVSAFDSEFGVVLDCLQTEIDETRVNISVGTPGGASFKRGAIHIDLRHDQESITSDSIDNGSIGCDSIEPNCDSISPSCPSIGVDFVPFIFN